MAKTWSDSFGRNAQSADKGSRMKGVWLFGLCAALAVLVFGGAWLFAGNAEKKAGKSASSEQTGGSKGRKIAVTGKKVVASASEAVGDAIKNASKPGKRRKHSGGAVADMFAHLQGEDRVNAEAVQAALDADDLAATLKAAKKSLVSTNAEVRLNAVEALGWFGVEALPELTACMSDADEEVRNSAANQWELAVQELERSDDQLRVSMAAFGTLSDGDQLTSIGGIIGGAAADLIDGEENEEVAANNRFEIVQALAEIIENGKPVNSAAAKELYDDITCHEWRGVEEAQRYLDDPDNYELPEDRGE